MTDESSQQAPHEIDPEVESMGGLVWDMLKAFVRNPDPVILVFAILATGLFIAYYVKRGLQVVVPTVIAVFVVGFLLWASGTFIWEMVTSPPSPPEGSGLVAAGLLVATAIIASLGYVAEQRGWMEVENDEPF